MTSQIQAVKSMCYKTVKICFINRWMDKQNVVYMYKGILSSLLEKGNYDTCYNMEESWGHYVNWNRPAQKMMKTTWFHFHKASKMVKFIEIESWMGVARGWGNREWGVLF